MWTSSAFYAEVLRQTPVFVWGILIALLVLGIRQLRDRDVPRWVPMIAPLVFLVIGLIASRRSVFALSVWGVTVAVTAALSYRLFPVPRGLSLDRVTQKLHIPGSKVPMLLMMTTFVLTYITNVAITINPRLDELWIVGTGVSVLLGGLTGLFLGRALKLSYSPSVQKVAP